MSNLSGFISKLTKISEYLNGLEKDGYKIRYDDDGAYVIASSDEERKTARHLRFPFIPDCKTNTHGDEVILEFDSYVYRLQFLVRH